MNQVAGAADRCHFDCRNVDWNYQHLWSADRIHGTCCRWSSNEWKCKYIL